MIAHAHMYYASTRINIVYIRITVYRALPWKEWIFHVFEGLFLEVPRVVLLLTIHCHHGIGIEDALFFTLE